MPNNKSYRLFKEVLEIVPGTDWSNTWLPLCGNGVGEDCRKRIMEMLEHRDNRVFLG
jgi:hypothetical protein